MDHLTALHHDTKVAQARAERHGHADTAAALAGIAAMMMAMMAAQDGGAASEAPVLVAFKGRP
jgi:hypothetical protein